MSDPSAIHGNAGFRTPDDVLADDSLSVGAKIDLLEQWKKTLTRVIENDPLPEETRRRAEEIDAAISALKAGR